jgi:TPR repeat protein
MVTVVAVAMAASGLWFAPAMAADEADWTPPQPTTLNDVFVILRHRLAAVGAGIEAAGQAPESRAHRLETAAAEGDADAQFELAVHYRLGLGVARDPAAALAWYRKAADKRVVDAQLALGDMLVNGDGGAVAPVEALAWWLVAARGGDPLAAAGAPLLGRQLTFPEQTEARQLARQIEGVWASYQR